MLAVRRNDMSVEARQYVQPTPAIENAEGERDSSVAELQRALSAAFAPPPAEVRLLSSPGEPADERLVRLVSRIAGYAILAGSLLGLALLAFGS
jgi:hypothetical protein